MGEGGKKPNKKALLVVLALLIILAIGLITVIIINASKGGLDGEQVDCDGGLMETSELLSCIEERYQDDAGGKMAAYDKAILRAKDAKDEPELVVLIGRKSKALVNSGDCPSALALYEENIDGLGQEALGAFYMNAVATSHECGNEELAKQYLDLANKIKGDGDASGF